MAQAGKVVFITGGLGDIGLVFGEHFLQGGAKVALVDIEVGTETEKKLKEKYGEDKVTVLQCDVTNTEQLRASYQKTVDTFGGLDIVINCAGIIDEIHYERTIAINLTAVITSSYMAVKRMRKDKGGRGGTLINISSLAGLKAYPHSVTYSATKGGVISFGKSLVANLGDNESTGIKVGTICPDKVDTKILQLDPNPTYRENDITPPNAKEVLALMISLVPTMEGSSPQRLSDALMKYLEEPNLHGSVIVVDPKSVHYVYPENLNGQKILMDHY